MGYGIRFQDRRGKVQQRDFETAEARASWADKALARGTADAILAYSDPRPETKAEDVEYLYRRGILTKEEYEAAKAEEIAPVTNPETGAKVYPHFDSTGEAITPERIAAAEARRSYGAGEVAECLRDTLLALVDVTDGPLPVVAAHQKVATVTDVSTDDIDVCGHMADFEVQTSDGRTFRVRLSETYRS